MASYASPTGSINTLGTTAGLMAQSGYSALSNYGNRYPNNSTVQGLVVGAGIDAARTQLNTASAIQYNDAFQGTLYRNQTALEQARTGNAATLMAMEGNINKDLYAVAGDQDRMSIAAAGTQDRLSRQAQGREDRATATVTGAERRLDIGAQGMMDRALARTQGEQVRLNQDNESLNVARLRNDARGSISRVGSRFYG